jgi:2-C-methyl-D-erythritol 2,4-cyclodiphosphate synthase
MSRPLLRIGHGFDSHPLVAGRPLRLGGVPVAYERGLQGHSDADVLLHAVANALLGAIGAGDLGRHFPPGEPRYRDADSGLLLARVAERVREQGYGVLNLDATLVAQAPRLAVHAHAMEQRIGQLVGAAASAVNVKISSPEGLGALGRGEGMAAWAVVLLQKTAPRKGGRRARGTAPHR